MSDWAPAGETFHDVVVVPYSDLLDRWRDGEIHRGGPIWPEWEEQVAARHRRGGRPVDVRPADPDGPIEEAGAMAWGGAPSWTPSGTRWPTSPRDCWPRCRPGPTCPSPSPRGRTWATRTSRPRPATSAPSSAWLGVAPERVHLITAPTRVAQLFVAPQAEQLGGPGPDDGYLDALDRLAATRLGSRTPEDGVLYVSRAGMEARFAGESYLEEVLRATGVRVLRPERLPLPEQLRMYRDAAQVVYAEGSALHSLQLLGRVDADVAVLERRPGTRLAQDNLRPRVRYAPLRGGRQRARPWHPAHRPSGAAEGSLGRRS